MKIGRAINNFADTCAPGVALAGLVLAPFTGGSSFFLAMQAIGTTKMIGYGIESIESPDKKD